ncbi:MAG: 2-oxoglutarate dehydrogenase E1 component [Trueperaceae bacterium]
MSQADVTMNSSSLAFVEEMYASYLDDPASVSEEWRSYFASAGNGHTNGSGNGTVNGVGNGATTHFRPNPRFEAVSLFNAPASRPTELPANGDAAALQHRVDKLVRNYRVRGHRLAKINPLGRENTTLPELDPQYYGFTEDDMQRPVLADNMPGISTLGELIEALKSTYTRSIGSQFMHIDNLRVRTWLQARMEQSRNRLDLSRDTQLRILTKLTDTEIFEEFIQKKFVGAKRFSLEGSESLIPLLDMAIEKAGGQGSCEVILAMAHRGRLNVLANIMGKSPRDIFREFEDVDPEMHRGRGDVKYHLGYSGDWVTSTGAKLHLSLCFNPSHLEFVNPVALGRTRAKQDRIGDEERERALAILIHGDASFIGEGVVQESLNLSELPGYRIGGALHVIVNNQLGFTTGPEQGRSSTYASDIAKMLQSPIFHVNGEDPEAVAQVIELAMDFRREFRRDVVIDMYAYRRHGHNEGDEPAFTQPEMYGKIRNRPTVREGYLKRLLAIGEIDRAEADKIVEQSREKLEQELSVARRDDYRTHYSAGEGVWQPYRGGKDSEAPDVDTGLPREEMELLLTRLAQLPEDFEANPKILRSLKLREEMARGERPLDWAAAEALALGSLASAGFRIRLTGQDSERGTFSHRHTVLHDARGGRTYVPLQHVSDGQAPVKIYNSPLSETGVLGFEYGYSLDWPDALVIWEAQYGDFNNAAQVIIDQFIASAEDKWRRLSGLVMLLPHGFEGSGPEHSSARLERFLQLCAEDNMQIVNPTTPVQYFHLLRRQAVRPYRKPLVVMSPKSLLRHPKSISDLAEFGEGRFERVLADSATNTAEATRVLLCSGKLYYELLAEREEKGRKDVALVRLEQLYPTPNDQLESVLSSYGSDVEIVWVQEEPENMGAWRYLRIHWGSQLYGRPFWGVSRPASASPATGSASSHRIEQAELIRAAFETVKR